MDESRTKSKANLAEARHAARKLLKDARVINPAVQINQVLPTVKQSFDLTVKGVDDAVFSGKGDAITQTRGSSVFILFNNARATVRKRFSVAHEIGHLYLGHLHGNSGSELDASSNNFDEVEANEFAAHLLIPPEMLRKDVKAGIKDVAELIKRYEVSEEAMWWQLRSTGILNQL